MTAAIWSEYGYAEGRAPRGDCGIGMRDAGGLFDGPRIPPYLYRAF